MENENISEQRGIYEFLIHKEVELLFADINIKLLRGKHLQKSTDKAECALLAQKVYFDSFRMYYQKLYGLELHERQVETIESYFYLDYIDQDPGALNEQDRRKPLTELQTLFGLMLMNMYYEKFFERVKQVSWSDIKEVILYSERQSNYKLVLFGAIREGSNYPDSDWIRTKGNFKNMVRRFSELGWITPTPTVNEDFAFVINTSIHRLEDLYRNELKNPDKFFSKIINKGLVNDYESDEQFS